MKDLKIAYADFWPEWNIEDFVTPLLEKGFNVIIDQNNPDVLIHSIFNRMQDSKRYKCKKILVLAENWRADQFGSDLTISFDPHSSTNYRLPLWQIYLILWPQLRESLFDYKANWNLLDFKRFCSFTVSNSSNFIRNGAFQQLSSYKKVHSYGRYMTNDMSIQNLPKESYWRDLKNEFFISTPHKFMMTYENSSYPYYCTEKIMDAFLVGSVPIYWGDPKVIEDWNEKAFISAMRHPNTWLNIVKELDQNDEKFMEMYSQPVFTDEQSEKHLKNMDNIGPWLIEKINKWI